MVGPTPAGTVQLFYLNRAVQKNKNTFYVAFWYSAAAEVPGRIVNSAKGGAWTKEIICCELVCGRSKDFSLLAAAEYASGVLCSLLWVCYHCN